MCTGGYIFAPGQVNVFKVNFSYIFCTFISISDDFSQNGILNVTFNGADIFGVKKRSG